MGGRLLRTPKRVGCLFGGLSVVIAVAAKFSFSVIVGCSPLGLLPYWTPETATRASTLGPPRAVPNAAIYYPKSVTVVSVAVIGVNNSEKTTAIWPCGFFFDLFSTSLITASLFSATVLVVGQWIVRKIPEAEYRKVHFALQALK